MKKILLVLIAGLMFFSCKKQINHGTGLLFDDEAYLKIPEKAHLVTRDYDDLPEAVSLMYYTPTPGDQGSYGTCVAWSTTYAAMTTCESIMNGRDNQYETTAQVYSPYYLFRVCNPHDINADNGMVVENALIYLRNYGVPKRKSEETYRDFNRFNISMYDDEPVYKIGFYARLIYHNDSNYTKIQRIKKSLSEKKPVVFSYRDYPKSFHKADSSDWYASGTLTEGGHAMLIIGYDDNHQNPNGIEDGAFLIQNSWGTDWGWCGYLWVNYNDLAEYMYQAYEMSPSIYQVIQYYEPEPIPEPEPQPEPKPQPKPQPKPVKKVQIFNGQFSLPLWKKDRDMEVQFMNNCYETTESYGYPTMFQLYMTNKKPCFVYAFASDNTTNKANLIFPLNNTSALLDYSENTVVYPSETQAVKLDDVPGTDYLIVLYSLEELDIEQIMEAYEDVAGNSVRDFDLYTAVKNAIGEDIVVSPSDTTFSKNAIDFSVKMEAPKKNKVLPIIIKIKHK